MLKPGRELDALIAEKVMGWQKVIHPKSLVDVAFGLRPAKSYSLDYVGEVLPYFSTDISTAWEVVGKLDGEWTITGHEGLGWEANFCSSTGGMDAVIIQCSESGETAPEAICLAALKAVGYNE